jgi:integrase/recombinase XerD
MQTINEAKSRFIFHCQFEKMLSQKTITSYNIDTDQFIKFIQIEKYPQQINLIEKNIIKKYLQSISNKKPKTIKRKLATLKALFNFIEFEDENFVNPFHKLRIRIKELKTLPVVLDIIEIQHLLKTMYKLKETFVNKKSYSFKAIVRDIAISELLFATGIRVSELCQLNVSNIDKNFRSIQIIGKGGKERRIQICNKETLDALKKYHRLFNSTTSESGHFFINRLQKPISSQSVRNMIKKYTNMSGIEKNVTPHTLRHTFATLLLEENVDIIYIQHLLGHSSIMTTQIYTHVNQSKQKQILKTKHPRKRFSLNGNI